MPYFEVTLDFRASFTTCLIARDETEALAKAEEELKLEGDIIVTQIINHEVETEE